MSDLNTIPGIGKTSIELLEVAGFLNVESLSTASVDALSDELKRANTILKISGKTPSRKTVESWIQSARKAAGHADEKPVEVPTMPVNYEGNPEVLEMLAIAPVAIPLPAKILLANKLTVGDIPPGILLSRHAGDLEVRIGDRETPRKPVRPMTETRGRQPFATGNVTVSEPSGSRLDIDVSRVKSISEMGESVKKRPTSRTSESEDRVALLRTPREKTNRGKDPQSRRYIRGVLHTHPVGIAMGALVTLCVLVMMPVAILSGILLLLSDMYPASYPWVSKWFLVFPAALPIFGLIYLIWGIPGRCRICGQRLFFPRNCLKNAKAHHLTGLGYIVPLCLHILLFRWFRCTYCATPIRLKK
jgi:hypothetical protein